MRTRGLANHRLWVPDCSVEGWEVRTEEEMGFNWACERDLWEMRTRVRGLAGLSDDAQDEQGQKTRWPVILGKEPSVN